MGTLNPMPNHFYIPIQIIVAIAIVIYSVTVQGWYMVQNFKGVALNIREAAGSRRPA